MCLSNLCCQLHGTGTEQCRYLAYLCHNFVFMIQRKRKWEDPDIFQDGHSLCLSLIHVQHAELGRVTRELFVRCFLASVAKLEPDPEFLNYLNVLFISSENSTLCSSRDRLHQPEFLEFWVSTVGAQSIARLCQKLVNCWRNIWAHRGRRKLRFFMIFLSERSWAGEWFKILTKVNS